MPVDMGTALITAKRVQVHPFGSDLLPYRLTHPEDETLQI